MNHVKDRVHTIDTIERSRYDPRRRVWTGRPLCDEAHRKSAARLRRLAELTSGRARALALELADRAEIAERLEAEMGGAVGVSCRAVVRPVPHGAARPVPDSPGLMSA